MSMKNEKRTKRASVYEEAKVILSKASDEKRDLTAEESASVDAMMADMDSLEAQYTREERMAGIEIDLKRVVPVAPRPEPEEQEAAKAELRGTATPEYRTNYIEWCRRGFGINVEKRDLEAGVGSEGGFTVPDLFERSVIEKNQQINVMRQLSEVRVAANLTKFAIEANLGSHAYVAEEGSASAVSDVSFGQVIIDAFKAVRLIKVSEELLQDTFFDLEAYLAKKMGTSLANLEETSFVNGTGSGEPDGVFPRSELGFTAASPTAILSDELIELFHSLKDQYRANATWLLNDSTALIIRKLVINAEAGNYVWQPGLQAGQPDQILGRPVRTSTAAPAATAALRPIAFGDFSFYLILDRAGQTLQRLVELYSETGQVGFKHVARHDGDLTITESVKHLLMAAS